jgi:hypothetical protein
MGRGSGEGENRQLKGPEGAIVRALSSCAMERSTPQEIIHVMPENRKSSTLRFEKIVFALFYLLLLTLIWRVIDFFDEALNGATKMSLGKYGLEGPDALIAQSVIIGILLLLVYQIKKWHAFRDPG